MWASIRSTEAHTITGGNATVYVSNIDTAARFYGDTLGLRLTNRFGDRWATVNAGPCYWTGDEVKAGLVLGLHPPDVRRPAPGTRGGVMFGLETYRPIEEVIAVLAPRGVKFTGDIIRYEAGHLVSFEDPDGMPSYINEYPPFMLEGADRNQPPSEGDRLISGGHVVVFVSNMDEGVRFYTHVLGMRLTNRFDDHLATVEAGRELVVCIHPRTPMAAPPGTLGAVVLGLTVDQPIERVVALLAQRGVKTGTTGSEHASVEISDPDGNRIVIAERAASQRVPASGALPAGQSNPVHTGV